MQADCCSAVKTRVGSRQPNCEPSTDPTFIVTPLWRKVTLSEQGQSVCRSRSPASERAPGMRQRTQYSSSRPTNARPAVQLYWVAAGHWVTSAIRPIVCQRALDRSPLHPSPELVDTTATAPCRLGCLK